MPAGLFCAKPFKHFEPTGSVGSVYLCCPAWLPRPVGDLLTRSVDEIWNGKEAQEIRGSILDGSFRYCDASRCPSLQTISGPVQRTEEVTDPDLLEVIRNQLTVLPYGPRQINCAYDRSCNLSCPSCRTEIIVENEQEILELQRKIESGALRDAHLLYITGSGDPFGGPYFRRWLRTMRRKDVPNLREIHLHTNALLWTPANWAAISAEVRPLIRSTHVSIDAATPESYALNRRGGDFAVLLENLSFIAELRRRGPLEDFRISMVVQENNFREMPAFVALGERFGVDLVRFNQLVNWGTYSDEEFRRRAVHLSGHPQHVELLALINDPQLAKPPASLGNLSFLLDSPATDCRTPR